MDRESSSKDNSAPQSNFLNLMPMNRNGVESEPSERRQVMDKISQASGQSNEAYSESELAQINEFQHTILRKYAMTGMISYADAPAFHNLVENRDYRILCIFEVFSQNRYEDDFLENLALIAQIVKEQEPFDSAGELEGQ